MQTLGLGVWEDSEDGLENIGLVFQNYVTYELCGLGISFLSLSSLACKIFVFCMMECLRSEASEKLHGFVPGMPPASWACEFGPQQDSRRPPGVHSSLGGGQGFFLCSVGSGPPYVLMDSRL